jgi:ABC-type phosphate/phosphonate transport system substrate-binding protein
LTPRGIATLPMYDFPDARHATDAWWSGLARHLRREGIAAPDALVRGEDLIGQWRDPALTISQTCGYLLTHQLKADLRPVATPHYTAPGCEGPSYASVILVRDDHPGTKVADFRGGVAVYSRGYSHAGYNSFRGLVSLVAKGAPFFSQVIASDSHLESIAAIAGGRGDIATIDAVVHAFVSRWRPEALKGTRSLGFTPRAPAPPYVAPILAPAAIIARLQAGLMTACADPDLAAVRDDLFIGGFSLLGVADYDAIPSLERAAVAAGYPELA